jgi:hypothetical protein
LRDPKVGWAEKREAEKLMKRCFQLLIFRTIQFLNLPKANKKYRKAGNKHPIRKLHSLHPKPPALPLFYSPKATRPLFPYFILPRQQTTLILFCEAKLSIISSTS